MSTPICDFVRKYINKNPSRLHMPGHKGKKIIGFEPFDITEVDGADELFTASGIIAESEANASAIFGAHTIYSAAGSTLCIQTMLHLISAYAISRGEKPKVLAARNAHKAFFNACALLDTDIIRLFSNGEAFYSCRPSASEVEAAIIKHRPTAVYLTSPDYLGNIANISGISKICRAHGVLLAVDNAHGAYLKLLPRSLHPIDLGADICCDSAHKTLPVITGGAYLHISQSAPPFFHLHAKASMSLFGSSSPSYLILQSLDAINDNIDDYKTALLEFIPLVKDLKAAFTSVGLDTVGDEPLKITVKPKSFGYSGKELAAIFISGGVYPEFYDKDFVVLMLTPCNSGDDLIKIKNIINNIKRRDKILSKPPRLPMPNVKMTPHDTIFSDSEVLPSRKCRGRICAASAIGCPPAVPLIVGGEVIDDSVIENLEYYGIKNCTVVK